ncbi:MAG: lamin tail domain-containing protein [Proteobacteria bacterium]|nr:lamin tail domain-containing protein [Pseudomonadota bacterium]
MPSKFSRYPLSLIAVLLSVAGCAQSEAPGDLDPECTKKADCSSTQKCVDQKCVPDPCYDGLLSVGETDVDCGGVCDACGLDQHCEKPGDCIFGECENNVCVDPNRPCRTPKRGEIIFSEILNNIQKDVNFDNLSSSQNEFFEIYNTTAFKLGLENVTLICTDLNDEDATPIQIALEGCMDAHAAAVLSVSSISVPQDVLNVTIIPSSNFLPPTGSYECRLVNVSDQTISTAYLRGGYEAGISETTELLDYNADGMIFEAHDKLSDFRHTPGLCTNGARFSDNCDTHCNDGQKNHEETDVDCGGPLCPACDVGKTCNNSHDCDSRQCVGNKCQEKPCTEVGCSDDAWCNASTGKCESCNDNTKNGTETDVDCGGSRCGSCEKGKTCSTNDDCLSHTCSYGRCTGDPCITPSPSSLIITEVMGAPNANLAFGTSSTNQMEFIEFVNKTSSRIDLSDVTLSWLKDGSTSPDTIAFSGCIEPKSAIVVSSAAIADLPSEVTNVTSMKNDTMTNSSLYHVRLDNLDTRIDEVTRQGTSTGTRGISQTRDPQLSPSATSLVLSNTVSTFSNTPGYCSNGGSYTQSCLDPCKDNQKTWNETDVDCGGDMCAKCTKGKACLENTDCESNICTANRCVGDPCYTPVAGELLITEVMGSPKSGGKFEFLTTTEQVEFIEIANASNRRLNLAEVTLNYQKGTDTTKTVALTGCIDPKNAVLVTSITKPLTGLPTGVSNQSVLSSATAITNNVAYQIWLETTGTDAVKIDEVTRAANSTTGISQSRNPTLDKTATLQLSNTVSDYANSPGYCSNGKEFIKECR